jgi:hypothetical protein
MDGVIDGGIDGGRQQWNKASMIQGQRDDTPNG